MDDPTLGSTPEGLESYSLTLSDVDEFDVTQPVDQDSANNEVIENAAVGTRLASPCLPPMRTDR